MIRVKNRSHGTPQGSWRLPRDHGDFSGSWGLLGKVKVISFLLLSKVDTGLLHHMLVDEILHQGHRLLAAKQLKESALLEFRCLNVHVVFALQLLHEPATATDHQAHVLDRNAETQARGICSVGGNRSVWSVESTSGYLAS